MITKRGWGWPKVGDERKGLGGVKKKIGVKGKILKKKKKNGHRRSLV